MKYLAILLIFPLCGCFHVGQYMKDHVWTNPGFSRSINHLEHTLIGTSGPDGIWVENEHGLRIQLHFDAIAFPNKKECDDLALNDLEVQNLSKVAESAMKNYFGKHRKIKLITFKRVSTDGRVYEVLLDAKADHQADTLGETMVKYGYYLVDEEVLDTAGYEHLIKVQSRAQRSRVNIWRKISAYNPRWHD